MDARAERFDGAGLLAYHGGKQACGDVDKKIEKLNLL